MTRYQEQQFERLEIGAEFNPMIQIIGNNGTKTNWMDISPDDAEGIIEMIRGIVIIQTLKRARQ